MANSCTSEEVRRRRMNLWQILVERRGEKTGELREGERERARERDRGL